jgi:hypothetical protein
MPIVETVICVAFAITAVAALGVGAWATFSGPKANPIRRVPTPSSSGRIPPGLTLYLFEYPEGHESEETWCCGPHGECVSNPPQCFIESDAEALRFGERFGASRVTNAITGRDVT